MALGRKCSSLKKKRGAALILKPGEEGLGLGLVKSTRGLGTKRVLITSVAESLSSPESEIKTPLKRQCSQRMIDLELNERSSLEALPQDILVSRKGACFKFNIKVKLYLASFNDR